MKHSDVPSLFSLCTGRSHVESCYVDAAMASRANYPSNRRSSHDTRVRRPVDADVVLGKIDWEVSVLTARVGSPLVGGN